MAKETGTMDQLKKTNLWLMCFFFAFTKWSSVNHSSFDLKKNKNYPKISFSLRCTTLFMVLAIIMYLWNNRPNRTKKTKCIVLSICNVWKNPKPLFWIFWKFYLSVLEKCFVCWKWKKEMIIYHATFQCVLTLNCAKKIYSLN